MLSVFSFVILLYIDKASEKRRNICNFNKFCDVYAYISSSLALVYLGTY